eukprot:scaffold39505_cov37-Cyclotella_meneghiniana.AAC.2
MYGTWYPEPQRSSPSQEYDTPSHSHRAAQDIYVSHLVMALGMMWSKISEQTPNWMWGSNLEIPPKRNGLEVFAC